MRILLTNDDGYKAAGIKALYERFRQHHEVTMVAPNGERSAVGHGITINEPLRMRQIRQDGDSGVYAVDGKPADCVKLSLFDIYDTPPDLVISGINAGSNTGVNIHYSGTAGAAREAALNGLPALAVSIKIGSVMDFEGMAGYTETVAAKVLRKGLPRHTFLNINAPAGLVRSMKGVRLTCQTMENVSTRFDKREDPRGRAYFWYGNMPPAGKMKTSDDAAINEGFISITPLQCDITDYRFMEEMDLGAE